MVAHRPLPLALALRLAIALVLHELLVRVLLLIDRNLRLRMKHRAQALKGRLWTGLLDKLLQRFANRGDLSALGLGLHPLGFGLSARKLNLQFHLAGCERALYVVRFTQGAFGILGHGGPPRAPA